MQKLWIRRIIFWFFIAVFLVSAPLAVLYTAGFRYNLQSGRVVRTGGISVSTVPRNANILLNEELTGRRTQYVFKRLIPGMYTLTLNRDGYRTWTGQVDVKSGEITLIENILLLRDDEPELIVDSVPDAITLNEQTAAYLVRTDSWVELWMHNLRNNSRIQVERIPAGLISDKAKLAWSQNGKYIFLFDESLNRLDVFSDQANPVELPTSLPADPQHIFWHPANDNMLYLATDELLYQVDLETKDVTEFEDPNAETVTLDASILRFEDNETDTELRQSVQGEETVLAILPKDVYRVVRRDGEFLILQNSSDTLMLLNIRVGQPILLRVSATEFDWLDTQDLLVYTDGFEVNMYDPAGHSTTFITRQGEMISSVLWHASANLILISTPSNLSVIERFSIAQKRERTPIVNDADIKTVWTEPSGKTAYFYGTYDGKTGLFSVPLTR